MRVIPRIRELRQSGMKYLVIQQVIYKEYDIVYAISTLHSYAQCKMDLEHDNAIMNRFVKEYESTKEVTKVETELENLYEEARIRGFI